MVAPRGPEVGAQLAELHAQGKKTLPLIAGEYDAASKCGWIEGVEFAMRRSANLGLGASGCYKEFEAMSAILSTRVWEAHKVIQAVGTNIVLTAEDMADVDTATANAFDAKRKELEG